MKSRRYSRVTCLLCVEELETRLTPAPVVLQPGLQITDIGTASDGPPAQMVFGPDGRLYMTLANFSGPNAPSVESFAYSPSGGLSDERTEVSTGGALGIGFGPVSLGVYGQPGVQTVTGMYLTDTARTINGNDVSNLRVLTQNPNGVWGGPNGGTDTIIVQNIPAGWHQADQIIIKQNGDGTSTLYVGIGVRTKDGALAYPNPGNARDMAYGGTISEILDLKEVNGLVTDSAGFGLTGVATSNSDPDYSNAGPYTSTAVNKLIIQSSGGAIHLAWPWTAPATCGSPTISIARNRTEPSTAPSTRPLGCSTASPPATRPLARTWRTMPMTSSSRLRHWPIMATTTPTGGTTPRMTIPR